MCAAQRVAIIGTTIFANWEARQEMMMSTVKALAFDVFGTVVDWRNTIIREGQHLARAKRLSIDWVQFADAWRAGYRPAMQQVRTGALPWQNLDQLHRQILDRLLVQFELSGLSEQEIANLNHVWHRLEPWPDAKRGLQRLRECFVVTPLSNGNMALLINLAKHAGLQWDAILSVELAKHYKPDPEVYQTAAALLDLQPHEIMMVAAHNDDLRAARAVGFRTAFVYRTQEYGPDQATDLEPDANVDIVAQDIEDLADKLCPMISAVR
jgi:2-haloacid dehalogenase